MQYRKDKAGNQLAVLGFGCMRFPKKGAAIDMEETEREIMEAYHAGINYFDTAYVYGGSEAALGEILEKNGLRDKVNVATKLPQYLVGSRAALDRYFGEELSRLRTDHVDYYLMHHLTDIAMWEKLKAVGAIDWLDEKKKSGAIRNVGFSYHGNSDGFIRILNDYDWDICQIQYNYFDEYSQAGVAGLKAAAEWSFRWLFDQPEVTVVLSGMNSMDMVRENCRVASEAGAGEFTAKDREILKRVTEEIRRKDKVGCTGCRYCMPCPKGVDIPGTFLCYNTMFIESPKQGRFQYAQTVGLTKEPAFASQCIGCGKCEAHCPQQLPIREKLKEADKALRPLPYKIGINVVRKFMFRKTRRSAAQGK